MHVVSVYEVPPYLANIFIAILDACRMGKQIPIRTLLELPVRFLQRVAKATRMRLQFGERVFSSGLCAPEELGQTLPNVSRLPQGPKDKIIVVVGVFAQLQELVGTTALCHYREGWVLSGKFSAGLTRLAEGYDKLLVCRGSVQERKERDLHRYL